MPATKQESRAIQEAHLLRSLRELLRNYLPPHQAAQATAKAHELACDTLRAPK
jgi:hypothetical protein